MIYSFGDYELDMAQVELRRQGESVALEPQVFALLGLLVENRERMLSKDEIIEKVWDGRPISDSALTSRIKAARRAVGDDGEAQRLIKTIRGRGFRFVAEVKTRVNHGTVGMPTLAPQAHAEVIRDAGPSVAVLPFRWLSSTQENSIVADALPHELIVALSRLRWLAVIARGSSFRFREPDADVHEISKALNVSYCVSGVVEGRDDNLIVTADLIDSRDGRVLWGERFSFQVDAIHEVRQQIVASIVAALEIQIPLNEAQHAQQTPPESLDAWANYHLGLRAMYRFNKGDNAAAEHYFQHAIKLDPQFARAHAGLSFTSFQDAFLTYGDDPAAAALMARRHAERSIELDPHDPYANFVMGRSFWLAGDIESSLGWLDRAIAFSPNFAQGLYARGWADTVAGRGHEGQLHADKAMRLSPLDPFLYAMMATRALAHIDEQEFDAALPWADRAANAPGAHVHIALIALIGNALAGNQTRAAYWAANARERRPDITREHFLKSFPFGNSEMRNTVTAVLKKYGV